MADIAIVDMSTEIEALKKQYGPEYRFNAAITDNLARIWGAAQSNYNSHGVLVNVRQEIIIQFGGCKASIEYAETEAGYWLSGLHAKTSISGFGYSPSLWDQIGFTSYDHARRAAIERFIIFFDEVVNCPDHYSKADVMNAKKAVMFLKAERNPQLSIFGPSGL